MERKGIILCAPFSFLYQSDKDIILMLAYYCLIAAGAYICGIRASLQFKLEIIAELLYCLSVLSSY